MLVTSGYIFFCFAKKEKNIMYSCKRWIFLISADINEVNFENIKHPIRHTND